MYNKKNVLHNYAVRLHKNGLSYKEIANVTGWSKSKVGYIIKGYKDISSSKKERLKFFIVHNLKRLSNWIDSL